MSIEKVLVLSTAHLPKHVSVALYGETPYGIENAFSREYGFILFPHEIQASHDKRNNVPESLIAAANLAKKESCTIIMFDCDGDLYDDILPVYD